MEDRRRPVDDPRPGRLPLRRVPGTAALGATNGIAALIAIDSEAFSTVLSLAYLQRAAGERVWAAAFAASAVLLTAAVIGRRWWTLNVGASLSLFLWVATGMSIIATWASGEAPISSIALAMVWWMIAGQASMLIVPLLDRTAGEA
jgi:hypothetical protein